MQARRLGLQVGGQPHPIEVWSVSAFLSAFSYTAGCTGTVLLLEARSTTEMYLRICMVCLVLCSTPVSHPHVLTAQRWFPCRRCSGEEGGTRSAHHPARWLHSFESVT